MLAVPRGVPAACVTCGLPVARGFARCRHCTLQRRELARRADVVLPVALCVRGGRLAEALWRYKEGSDSVELLRSLLGGFLEAHEGCLAEAAGVEGFPAVAVVPSSRGRPPPVTELVSRLATLAPRLRGFAGVGAGPVLLVDDMWTTGWHAQLAAAALKHAGCSVVGTVVLGRFLRRPPAAAQPWSPDRCAEHRGAAGYCR